MCMKCKSIAAMCTYDNVSKKNAILLNIYDIHVSSHM